MRTLREIIDAGEDQGERSVLEQVAAAAYWAGQSEMRGRITRKVAAQLASLPSVRYHRIALRAARHVLAVGEINSNVLAGRRGADAGEGESGEIMGWDFDA